MRLVPVLLAAAACGAPERGAPDIVLITLDTTRADRLGAYGCPRPNSPNLDRFAKQAVRYERAWTTAPWTLPAHASMLTGKYASRHGAQFVPRGAGDLALSEIFPRPGYEEVRASPLAASHETLAEMLAAKGYATGAFAGGPWLDPVFGLMQGYERQEVRMSDVNGTPADALTDAALAWIGSVPARRPLHLLVNYFDPHDPYAPQYRYDDLPAAERPLLVSDAEVNRGAPLSAAARAGYVDRYDAEIRFMDEHLGRLLDGLRRAGRWKNALVVVTADHGEAFGEDGFIGHGFALHDPVLRVPLLVRHPRGRSEGTVSRDLVSVADIFHIAAAAAGVAPAGTVDAVPPGTRRNLVAETRRSDYLVRRHGPRFDADLVCLISWPWKLTRSNQRGESLHNLAADPGERSNVQNAALATRLREQLGGILAELPAGSGAPAQIAPELRERLRSLGYVN